MKPECLLGVDIDTQGTKAVLVDIRVPDSQVTVLDGMARLATAGPG